MNIETPDRLTIKLFAGCMINSEMRMHLNHSTAWKHTTICHSNGEENPIEVHYQGKDYLGYYLKTDLITLNQLLELELLLKGRLKSYSPEFDPEKLKLTTFAQVFVA